MPVAMIHLSVAKKVNPDASIDFYVGTLAPDAIQNPYEIKNKVHLYDAPDWEDALRKFALKANNDYLKGFLLHLFADKKFHAFWNENTDMPYQEGNEFCWAKYMEHNRKIDSYAYHNTEWAYNLFKQMENWNYNNFIETEYIKQEVVRWFIPWKHKWCMENKLSSSSVFPPVLIEKFVDDTVKDFNKWWRDLNFLHIHDIAFILD